MDSLVKDRVVRMKPSATVTGIGNPAWFGAWVAVAGWSEVVVV